MMDGRFVDVNMGADNPKWVKVDDISVVEVSKAMPTCGSCESVQRAVCYIDVRTKGGSLLHTHVIRVNSDKENLLEPKDKNVRWLTQLRANEYAYGLLKRATADRVGELTPAKTGCYRYSHDHHGPEEEVDSKCYELGDLPFISCCYEHRGGFCCNDDCEYYGKTCVIRHIKGKQCFEDSPGSKTYEYRSS